MGRYVHVLAQRSARVLCSTSFADSEPTLVTVGRDLCPSLLSDALVGPESDQSESSSPRSYWQHHQQIWELIILLMKIIVDLGYLFYL